MSIAQETELGRKEVDDFLSARETGVISMARDSDPYAIPVSFGYDSSDRCFYLRLVSTPESEKRRYLASSPMVRLVVYDESGGEYRSVVVKGSLEEITREELTAEHVEQYGDAKRPLFEIWGRDKSELDVELYRIDPDDVSGRLVEIERAEV